MFADILERCRDLFVTDRRDLEFLFRRTAHQEDPTEISDREMFANLAAGDLTLAALQKSLRRQDDDAVAAQFLKYLRQRVLPKFPFRFSEREDLCALLVEDREAANVTLQWAEQICARTFYSLYHGMFHMGSYLDWYSDLAGKSWFFENVKGMREKVYQERLHETLKMGPLRATWDLNALHHLVELGKAWWITDDDRFASQYALQALDWMEKNPPNMGVNWMDEMAVARRAVAWVFSFQLFLNSPAVTPEFATRAVKTALMHGAYLADYLRHARDESRPGYRLAAAAALHLVAVSYPEFRSCGRWREIAQALLPTTLEEEFGENGAHRSGSVDMHRLCCEFALLPFILAEVNGENVDRETYRRTLQAFQFLVQVQEPESGAQPIGAIWPERVLCFGAAFQPDVPGLIGLASVLLNREDLRRASRPSWMIVWLSGFTGVNRYQQMGKMAAEVEKVRAYEQASLVVLREGWGERDFWAALRVVPSHPQEVGGRIHDDLMHLSVAVGGSRVFTDTGSLVAEDERSRYFDSPLAHNVVVVRDAEPVPIAEGGGQGGGISVLDGDRIWIRAGRRAWVREEKTWWHRRDLLFDPAHATLAICDALEGDGPADVEVSFHSPIDLEIVQRGDLGCIFWKRTGLFRLHPFFPDSFRGFVDKGASKGLPAVLSRDGISLEPLQRIRYTARLAMPGWMIFWMTWDNTANTPSLEEVKAMFAQLGARPAPPQRAAGGGRQRRPVLSND
ncbi:MAG: hypothetical protein EB084_05615 [Proteobacteria bacterium]|nr:hypothetical protein [Pseudomonadota bacterium]